MDTLLAVIGLGNPGKEYEYTRHNVGFHVVDVLSEILQTSLVYQKVCSSIVSKVRVDTQCSVILAKPQTYMNRSGEAVQSLLRWYGVSPQQCVVIVDNTDLNLGTVRAKGRGSGGTHNGIRSIHAYLKSVEDGLDYVRVYIGVGSPRPHQPIAKYVLEPWHKSEQEAYVNVFTHAARAILKACIELSLQEEGTHSLKDLVSSNLVSNTHV